MILPIIAQFTNISNAGFAASFTYDSLGRRTGKTVQGTTTNYLYDGLNVVQEKAGATVTANLLTGLGIDEILTRTDGTGARGFLPDALGSTVALADNTGTLQTNYTYEPFGYTSVSGQANANSFKYTGREDDGSGLYYYRARYYHPRLQRFISEDPIGFRGGDPSLYAYVLNNSVNQVDRNGMSALGTAAALGCAAYDIYDIYQTSQGLARLAEEIDALNALIYNLERLCTSGKGSDSDFERLRRLQQEGLQKLAEYNRRQVWDYAPNAAIFFLCGALALL